MHPCAHAAPFWPDPRQDIANLLWAFGTVRLGEPELFSVLGEAAVAAAPALKPQELANVVWALGRVRHHDPGMGDCAAQPAPNRAWVGEIP